MEFIVTYQLDKENDIWKTTKFTDKEKAEDYYNRRLNQGRDKIYFSIIPNDNQNKGIPPKYCEENYKFKQGGNLWYNYGNAPYKTSNEEINNRVKECVHLLNHDMRLPFVNKSNGDTLIIAERSEFGHYSVYVAKDYKECTVEPSNL